MKSYNYINSNLYLIYTAVMALITGVASLYHNMIVFVWAFGVLSVLHVLLFVVLSLKKIGVIKNNPKNI